MAKILVGTSGWSYKHWRGRFYPFDLPPTDWLEYYSEHFETVEINTSFYHLPEKATFKNWAKITPKGFKFAVKGSQVITHYKYLQNVGEEVKRFFEASKHLGEKLAVVLWQLPPRFKYNKSRLGNFLEIIKNQDFSQAIELRNQSWFNKETIALLKNYGIGLCVSDYPDLPEKDEVTSDFAYFRRHGAGRLYGGSYSEESLRGLASQIRRIEGEVKEIYVFFNNDAQSFAVKNAKTLIEILK